MKEKSFETKVRKLLNNEGAWHVKFFANAFTKVGIPDILVCRNGLFLGIEVKGTGGKPSQLQLYHRDEIRRAGGIAIILYPHQWEQFQLMLEQLKTEPFKVITETQYLFD